MKAAREGRVTTVVAGHTCAHAEQDARYGAGQRVWNATKGGRRCTVCGGEVIDLRTAIVRVEGRKLGKKVRDTR